MINKQKGAVSLFVVIFATLLITIITISFAKLMTSDQQQATTADLSQSAYDSAQAGVEDAKRALLLYQRACDTGTPDDCVKATANIDSPECNVGLTGIMKIPDSNGEVLIQQSAGDSASALDQAYTCVTIARNTDDYKGVLQANASRLVPLVGMSVFDSVLIEWYTADDMKDPSAVDLETRPTILLPLLSQNLWSVDKPSIMRTQIMQFGNGFKLTDFDGSSAGSNANTLFLYPVGFNSTIKKLAVVDKDIRKTATGRPLAISCSKSIAGGGFACQAQLTLPKPVNVNEKGDRTAFLRLTSLYNKAHYRVTLSDSIKTCNQLTREGEGCVKFDGVQPEIDSTGRANDLFRRVKTRVEFGDPGFPYPNAAVQTTGSFCKNFRVTDIEGGYLNNVIEKNGGCSPAP